ncbi:MAG: HK97 gp10 family phage protein [Ruminococcus sp.]|nr:HK97 gp10 family phage protein [Ruminococcus sp.]
MNIRLENNSVAVKEILERGCEKWLEKTAEAITQKVRQNTSVDTGETRDGWEKIVNKDAGVAIVGNTLENAVWEEFGTGEYALSGDGRKGGWVYADEKGGFHFTRGKPPKRAFHKAYLQCENEAALLAEKIIREELK